MVSGKTPYKKGVKRLLKNLKKETMLYKVYIRYSYDMI